MAEALAEPATHPVHGEPRPSGTRAVERMLARRRGFTNASAMCADGGRRMMFNEALTISAGLLSIGTAAFVLVRERKSFVRWTLVFGLSLMGVENLLSSLSLRAVPDAEILMWQRFRLPVTSLTMAAWLLFSLSYARGDHRTLARKRHRLGAIALVLLAVIVSIFRQTVFDGILPREDSGVPVILYNTPARLIHVVLILVAVLTIMNLERTLRAATGTMRWRIKFMIIGIITLLATRIYIGTQALLYSSMDLRLDGLNASVLILCEALILSSLVRTHLMHIDLYPSQHVLYRSVTAVLAGLYLLAVGVMAHLATRYGFVRVFPLQTFILFSAVIGLSLLAISDRVRQSIRRFVASQFGRPMYDCRKVWTDFTDRTASCLSAPELCHAVANMVSDTFEVLSVTIWLVDEPQRKLLFGASTSLSGRDATVLDKEDDDDTDLVSAIRTMDRPTDIHRADGAWVDKVKRRNPLHFPDRGEQLLCVPLATGAGRMGLMVLADRVRGIPYSTEETDLLKTIGEQVGAKLLNIRLSARLLEAKQMEAFQAMSAFFVHDLKNTSSTLSLMLQNLPKHFENPTFREDALAAMSKSVAKINDLINRLTTLRQNMDIVPEPTDLNELAREIIAPWNRSGQIRIRESFAPVPSVRVDPEQMRKVLTNLFLNARDAMDENGDILVETGRHGQWVSVTVRDNGCGMSREFVANSLFRPFKSTKQAGMGIGLFHSRMIVEAHQGRLEVESTEGKGSAFRILLPLREEI